MSTLRNLQYIKELETLSKCDFDKNPLRMKDIITSIAKKVKSKNSEPDYIELKRLYYFGFWMAAVSTAIKNFDEYHERTYFFSESKKDTLKNYRKYHVEFEKYTKALDRISKYVFDSEIKYYLFKKEQDVELLQAAMYEYDPILLSLIDTQIITTPSAWIHIYKKEIKNPDLEDLDFTLGI